MSNISTIYDTILAAMTALFPTKTRIPNAYSLSDNQSHLLRDGYGVKLNSASSAEGEICGNFNVNRDISIVFTQEIVRGDSEHGQVDTAVKNLAESVVTLQKDFYHADRMGIPSNVSNIELSSISGVEFFISGKNNFISMEISFNFYIRENIS